MNNNSASSDAKVVELEAPVVLTPDQIAAVAGGAAAAATLGTKNGGATMGIIQPLPPKTLSV